MKTKKFPFFLLGLIAASGIAHAQTTVSTSPVGFVSKTIPAGSDATYAPAIQQPPAFTGTISQIVSSSVIQISGSPGWTAGQFTSSPYYVQVTSGQRAGLVAQITANDASTLTLSFFTQNLGSTAGDQVLAGDSINIVPYWTLGTLLPDASVPNGTIVFLYDRTQAGINQSASGFYTMYSGYGWYSGPTNGEGQIIDPDESIVIRAPSGQSITLTQSGAVPMAQVRTTLQNLQANIPQDIRTTTGLPVPVALGDFLNLGNPETGDIALIFDDTATGQNKSAAFFATYYSGYGWYNGPTNENTYQLQPGQGFVYRKAGANSGTTLVVTYQPSYQQ